MSRGKQSGISLKWESNLIRIQIIFLPSLLWCQKVKQEYFTTLRTWYCCANARINHISTCQICMNSHNQIVIKHFNYFSLSGKVMARVSWESNIQQIIVASPIIRDYIWDTKSFPNPVSHMLLKQSHKLTPVSVLFGSEISKFFKI